MSDDVKGHVRFWGQCLVAGFRSSGIGQVHEFGTTRALGNDSWLIPRLLWGAEARDSRVFEGARDDQAVTK